MVFVFAIFSNHCLRCSLSYWHTAALTHLHDKLKRQFTILVATIVIDSLHCISTESFTLFMCFCLVQILEELICVDSAFLIREPFDESILF